MGLPTTNHELLPPELLLDENNPANDEYFKGLNLIKRHIVQQSIHMNRRHVEVTKLRHSGANYAEIADRVNIAERTVYTVLSRPDAKLLTQLLIHYQHFIDGPNVEQRKNGLWRIFNDCEIEEPKTAIAAIAELNKMTGAYPTQDKNPTGAVTIIINQQLLPKGALDL